MNLPEGPSFSKRSRAWPPVPRVASTNVSPGCGSSKRSTSSGRTETWMNSEEGMGSGLDMEGAWENCSHAPVNLAALPPGNRTKEEDFQGAVGKPCRIGGSI